MDPYWCIFDHLEGLPQLLEIPLAIFVDILQNDLQLGNSFFGSLFLHNLEEKFISDSQLLGEILQKKQRLPGLAKEANAWAFGHIPQRLSLLASLRAAQNENGLVPVTPASWEMAPWVLGCEALGVWVMFG